MGLKSVKDVQLNVFQVDDNGNFINIGEINQFTNLE